MVDGASWINARGERYGHGARDPGREPGRVFERFYRADAHSAARTRGPTGAVPPRPRHRPRPRPCTGGELVAKNEGRRGQFTLTLPAGS